MLDFLVKLLHSKWWYLLIIGFIILINQLLITTKRKSETNYQKLEKILLLSIGVPIIIMVFLIICFFIYVGFLRSQADNIFMLMITGLGLTLLLIPVIYKIRKK